MSDGGFDGQLVGEHDPLTGAIVLTGWGPGPAGVSGLTLAGGGLELSVDHAGPLNIVSVAIDAVDDDVVAALDILLVGSARRVLDEIGTTRRVVWPLDDVDRVGARRAARPTPLARLGRLAILRSEVERLGISGEVRAAGLVELANLTVDAPRALGVAPTAEALWRTGVERLAAAGAAWFADLGARAAQELSFALQWSVKGLHSVDPALADTAAQLADLARPRRGGLPDAPAFDAGPISMQPSMKVRLDLGGETPAAKAALSTVAGRPGGVGLEVQVVPPLDARARSASLQDGHVAVELVGLVDPPSVWCRAFLVGGRPVLLAMAPFHRSSYRTAQARVLVPVDLPPDAIALDVTLEPEAGWRSPALHAVERAVDLGRRACRAERMGDRPDAWESWHDCAEEWDRAGDVDRSQQALAYAEANPDRRGTPGRRAGQRPFAIDWFDEPW